MPTVTVIQPTIAAEQNTKIRCAAYCRVSSYDTSYAANHKVRGESFQDGFGELCICRQGWRNLLRQTADAGRQDFCGTGDNCCQQEDDSGIRLPDIGPLLSYML